VFRQQASPLMVVITILVMLAVVAGVYLVLMRRAPETPQAPAITNDPYAGQYKGGPAPARPPEGVPAAP
jgi:hypothetical protein